MIKLYLNQASPYARLVMVVAHEKDLDDRIEPVMVDPWSSPQSLLAVNPYSKVPALELEDGTALVESGCICDYLDAIGDGKRLLPEARAERITALRKYGLGRALIDSAFGTVIERRFSPADGALAGRWLAAVDRGIRALEGNVAVAADGPDLGDLAIAVGLAYTEFRLPEVKWRESAPRLSAWLAGIAARPSLQRTAPE